MSKKRAIKVYVSDELHNSIKELSECLDISMSQLLMSAFINFAQTTIEEITAQKSLHHTSSVDS